LKKKTGVLGFSTRRVQSSKTKTPQIRFGESPCQKLFAKKVERKKFLSFFPVDYFIAFLAVSLHEELKNTTNIFSKIRLENLKKS
jgi:hypothetical protein